MVQPGPTEELILWVTAVGMALATVAFVGMGWGETDRHRRAIYVVTSFVVAISFTAYFAMATGFGIVEVGVGGERLPIYWARYADWLFTTPLILLDLGLLVGADRQTIGTLVGLDVAMILTAAAGALATQGGAVRIGFWLISSAFFLALLYVLVGRLSRQAGRRTAPVAATFATLRNLIVVLWTGYLLVWVLGVQSTVGLIPLPVEVALYAALDLGAKVAFGLILLRSRGALDQVARRSDAAAAD